jgi:hypothetical protein
MKNPFFSLPRRIALAGISELAITILLLDLISSGTTKFFEQLAITCMVLIGREIEHAVF